MFIRGKMGFLPVDPLACTGNDDPFHQAAPEENGRGSFSGSAIQPSLLCGAVSSEKSPDVSRRNRDRRMLSRAAPRNHKLRTISSMENCSYSKELVANRQPTSGSEGCGDFLGREKLPSAASPGARSLFHDSPRLADLPIRCLPDLTPAVWVARHSQTQAKWVLA